MGADVWKVFRALPEVLDAVKGSTRQQGTPGGLATVSECKGLFEVENWLVGRARYNAAKEGQTASYARLSGQTLREPSTLSRVRASKRVTFGLTLSEMLERQTQRDFDKKRGVKGAHYFKVAWNSDEKIIANDLGYFIQDAVA